MVLAPVLLAADINPVAAGFLADIVFPAIAAVLTVVLPYLAHRMIRLAEQKWGISLTEKQEAQLDAILERAVLYAESKATASVKSGAAPTPGQQKALDALAFVVREAEAVGVRGAGQERLRALLQAKFGAMTAYSALPGRRPDNVMAGGATPPAVPAPEFAGVLAPPE